MNPVAVLTILAGLIGLLTGGLIGMLTFAFVTFAALLLFGVVMNAISKNRPR